MVLDMERVFTENRTMPKYCDMDLSRKIDCMIKRRAERLKHFILPTFQPYDSPFMNQRNVSDIGHRDLIFNFFTVQTYS